MASTLNKNFLQETLKLQALPSIQIYAGEILLDSFSCPPEKTAKLMQTMKNWVLQAINSYSKAINSPFPWDSLPPPSSFLDREARFPLQLSEEDYLMLSQGNPDFFEPQISGGILFSSNLDTDSNCQKSEDSEAPRNNIIASPGASEFFSLASDVDIPLQLSDLFLLDDDEDTPV